MAAPKRANASRRPRAARAAPRSAAASSPDVLVVVTTVGTEQQALDMAQYLVAHRLAACVNIVPGVRSVFRWKGKVNCDGEFFLVAKTRAARFEKVRRAMKDLNAYELPEILAFPAEMADAAFASWVLESTLAEKTSSPRRRAPR